MAADSLQGPRYDTLITAWDQQVAKTDRRTIGQFFLFCKQARQYSETYIIIMDSSAGVDVSKQAIVCPSAGHRRLEMAAFWRTVPLTN